MTVDDWPDRITGRQIREVFDILGMPEEHWIRTSLIEIRADPHEVRIRRFLPGEDGKLHLDEATGGVAAEEKHIRIDWDIR